MRHDPDTPEEPDLPERFDLEPVDLEPGDLEPGDLEPAAEVAYQPSSPRDLDRHPPRGPACLGVRARLRAYADAELTSVEREQVDDHLHGCRECGVALSRAEAEVHRLRTLLAAPSAEMAGDVPGPTFVKAVMRRVTGELRPTNAGAVSDDFTPRVMDRVRREWRAPRLSRRLDGLLRRQFAVLTAAVAFLLLAVGYFASGPSASVQVQLVTATATTVARDGRVGPALDGQYLATDDIVHTEGERGRATLRVPRASDPSLDHAILTLDPGTNLALAATPAADAESLFRLAEGAVAFHITEQRLSVSLDAHCAIAMAPGSYRLSAEPVVRHDSPLAQAPFVAVRLEVEAGVARIVRGQLPPTVVEAGMAAVFDGWSPIAQERLLDEAELIALAARGLDFAAARAPAGALRASDWLGRVVNGQTGASVAGATVRIASRRGELVTTSGPDGAFWLREQADLEGETALVQVTLPMGAPGHAYAGVASYFGPVEFVPRGRGPARELVLDPLPLPAERPVMGMVLDPTGRPLSGARVTALLVDQVMGGAQSLSPGNVPAAVTGGDGRFELRGLAATSPPHTVVYLTVEHARYGTVASADLLAAQSLHDLSLQIGMVARRVVTLEGLPGRSTVELLESIANLPAEAMVLVRRVATDDAGEARLDVGAGANIWLRTEGKVIALTPEADRAERWRLGTEPASGAVAAWGVAPVRESGAVVLRGVARHHLPGLAGATAPRGLRVVDAEGRQLVGALLFLQHANGEGCYLGTMRSSEQLWDLPVGGDYRLVAVTEDGAVGVLDATAADGNVLNVRVVPAGAAQLPLDTEGLAEVGVDGTTAIFVVELTRMDGPLAGTVIHRHTNADVGWAIQGVVSGLYAVRLPNGLTGSVYVPSGGVGQVDFAVPDAGHSGAGRRR